MTTLRGEGQLRDAGGNDCGIGPPQCSTNPCREIRESFSALFYVGTPARQEPAIQGHEAEACCGLHPAVLAARDLRRRAGLTTSLESVEVLAKVIGVLRHGAGCSAGPDRNCGGARQPAQR